MCVRRVPIATLATVAGLGLIAWLCVDRADEVAAAVATIPLWGFAAAVALHLATLFLRSEAWRLTLGSIEGHVLPRRCVHGANAAAFVAGIAQSQAALPARVAMLVRLGGAQAPRPAQICMADVPIFALELLVTSALLFGAAIAGLVAPWVAPAALTLALGVLLAARYAPQRFAGRPMVRGLAVLADHDRRGQLVAVVGSLSALTVLRIWLVLLVCGLPHGVGHVAALFAALGVFGLLPFGPGAPAGAALATAGSAGVGTAVAAGLAISASSIAAVVIYAVVVAAAGLGAGARSPARPRSARSRSKSLASLARWTVGVRPTSDPSCKSAHSWIGR